MANYYADPCIGLTGGLDGYLDAIDGATVSDGCFAVTVTNSGAYLHQLDEDSAAAESSPSVIKPDSNAGDKRWVLRDAYNSVAVAALAAANAKSKLVERAGHAVDIDQTNLTADGTWYSKDMSAIVPAGATAILLQVYIDSTTPGSAIQFRANGSTASHNAPAVRCQVANVPIDAQVVVFCDANRVIQYAAAAGGVWTEIRLTVAGWYL